MSAPVDLDGVAMTTLPAGREAVATHHGANKDIPKTFAAPEKWVANNAQVGTSPGEVYLNNRDEIPMAERATEIVYPID